MQRNFLEIKTPEELYWHILKRGQEQDFYECMYNNRIGYSWIVMDGKLLYYNGNMYFTTNKEAFVPSSDDYLLGPVDDQLRKIPEEDFVFVITSIEKGNDVGHNILIGVKSDGATTEDVAYKLIALEFIKCADIQTVNELNFEIDASKALR